MSFATRMNFLVALPLLCLGATGTAADSLRIATFNAEFLTRPNVQVKFDLNRKLTPEEQKIWDKPGYRDARFATATRRVARYIAEHVQADILVLTEVGNRRDVEELRTELKKNNIDFPHFEVCDCTDHNTRQHVAVLSKFKLFSVERSLPGREGYITELDDPHAEEETGISKGMRVRFRAANETFTLFAVHLASERGGHAKDAKRIAQASILRRLTLKALEAREHVIIAGDLNDRRGDPALRRVRGLDDIWPDLVQTGHSKYFDDPAKGWTSLFKGQRELIDHVLLSQSIFQKLKRGKKGIRAKTGKAPGKTVSDHRPLIVTLTFR